LPAFFSPQDMRALLQPIGQMQQEPAAFADYRRFYRTDFAGATTYSGLLKVLDYQLVVQLWQPVAPRGTLMILHGYYDHLGLYRHLIRWALGQGFAVFACDLPGHGLSSGARADIGDFAEYQATLQALLQQAAQLELPKPWHLLGQSTGAGILLDYLLRGAVCEEIGQIILLAPLIRPRAWAWSKLLWYLIGGFKDSIERRFTDNSNDSEFLSFIRQEDPLQPRQLPCRWVGALMRWIPLIENAAPSERAVLLVQGDADHTLNWQHNLKVIQKKLPNARRLLLSGAKHHLANESENLRQHYLRFLEQNLA